MCIHTLIYSQSFYACLTATICEIISGYEIKNEKKGVFFFCCRGDQKHILRQNVNKRFIVAQRITEKRKKKKKKTCVW